jgi:hypothetical protein
MLETKLITGITIGARDAIKMAFMGYPFFTQRSHIANIFCQVSSAARVE